MTARKALSIVGAALAAAIVVSVSCVVLGVCLGQPLEDMRPEFAPLVNMGSIAILGAIAAATFCAVFKKMRR